MSEINVGRIIKVKNRRDIFIGKVVAIFKGHYQAYLLEYSGEWLFKKEQLDAMGTVLKEDKAYFWAWEGHVLGKGVADTKITRKLYPDVEEYEGYLIV